MNVGKRSRVAKALAAIGACLLLWPCCVCAATPSDPVGLVRDADSDPRINEVRKRIAAELVAAGFAWALVQSTDDLFTSAAGRPWALVFVSASAQGIVVEIALPGRQGAGIDARRLIPIGASSALTPTELALRAVEVLRAHVAAGPVGRATPTQAPPTANLPRQGEPLVFQMEAGASVLRGTDGLEAGVGPCASFAISRAALGLRVATLSSVWWGEAQGADVRAQVSQWLFTAEALWFLRPARRWVRPFVFLGAGGLRLQADAVNDDRLVSTHASHWAFASKVGAGAVVALGSPRLHLVVELGLVATEPAVAVQVIGPTAGVAGRPTQLMKAALSWSL